MRVARRLAPVLLALAMLALVPGGSLAADTGHVEVRTSVLASFAIGHPERRLFGRLEWIGGFEVEAEDRDIGGFSSLAVLHGGASLLTISDNSLMLAASIRRDAAGRPVGLADARVRGLTVAGANGPRPVHDGDSESFDLLPGTSLAAVSFEVEPRVYVGQFGTDGFIGPMAPVALPASTKTLRRTKGLESLAAVPSSSGLDGTMVILAERAELHATTENQPGWLIGGTKPVMFRVHRTDDYDLTDAKFGPDGRLYVLERFYSLLGGIGARIRRFDATDIAGGALLDGETIFEASLADQIDNMEGLSIWTNAAGDTIVSLISDNNRSILERTLYLEFRLGG